MISCILTVLTLFFFPRPQAQAPSNVAAPGAPAFSQDGRLALAWNRNLWLVSIRDTLTFSGSAKQLASSWLQLTNSAAEDRDPTWTPDGRKLVFASNRKGNFDLWELQVGRKGVAKEPVRLTNSRVSETEPDVSKDGTLVWVRGAGPDANLWLKPVGQQEKQLTEEFGAEYSPTISPDGRFVAYIAERMRRKQLRILRLRDLADSLVVGDMQPEYPAWSPDGKRISFSTRGSQTGVWLTTPEGKYKNLLSSQRAAGAWSPDGACLALAPLPRNAPSYNGDPAARMPRFIEPLPSIRPAITFVQAPPPDTRQASIQFDAATSDHRNGVEKFDRVADYLANRYRLDAGQSKAAWRRLRQKYRAAALAAKDDVTLEKAIDGLLRDRPLLRQEAIGRAAASSAHPLATAAGLEILEQGGNVVDAAVAVSFAIGVVEPDASGPGGYGEMLIYRTGMDAPMCIEFLTRVPEAASLSNGALDPLPQDGPVLANVPGTVAGMELAWKRFGGKKLTWAQLIEPAIKLAESGFVLDDAFPTTLAKEKERYTQYESSKALFFPNGKALQSGDSLRNPDLAWTLRQIAEKGGKAFYKGEIAKRMVEDLRGKGNAMTLEDLARYYAVERQPVKTTYRGYSVYSGPPPVAGGAALAGKLNLLEQFRQPKLQREDAATLHSMIEAWKLAPSTRGRIADPGLWPVDLNPFTDKEWARQRWQSCFDPQHSLSPDDTTCLNKDRIAAAWGADGVLDARTSAGTTAFVVADAEGNMAAVTQTLGTWGGNFYVTPGLGFIYNDKLRSYSSNPKRYNARIPFARNVTSIAPTLIFKGTGKKKQPYLAVGAAGNAWITSAVYQIVAGVIDQELGPQQAIEQPRFLVGVRRDPKDRDKIREIVVQVEDGFAPGVLEQLQAKGHDLQRISARGELRMGYAAAALIDGKQVRAGADPRRSGQAGAMK